MVEVMVLVLMGVGGDSGGGPPRIIIIIIIIIQYCVNMV